MDKVLRNTIIIGITIITFSIVYYAIYLPLKKELWLKRCLKISEENYSSVSGAFEDFTKKGEITLHSVKVLDEAKEEKKIEDDRCYNRFK